LVDRSVILNQSVCPIFLLDKERRCSPSRETWTNEAFLTCNVDFSLKLKKYMWWHLVGALGYRGSDRFQVDDKLDSSSRGYPWELLGKDILKIMNNWNVLDAFKR
jgi:hypothetical protein